MNISGPTAVYTGRFRVSTRALFTSHRNGCIPRSVADLYLDVSPAVTLGFQGELRLGDDPSLRGSNVTFFPRSTGPTSSRWSSTASWERRPGGTKGRSTMGEDGERMGITMENGEPSHLVRNQPMIAHSHLS